MRQCVWKHLHKQQYKSVRDQSLEEAGPLQELSLGSHANGQNMPGTVSKMTCSQSQVAEKAETVRAEPALQGQNLGEWASFPSPLQEPGLIISPRKDWKLRRWSRALVWTCRGRARGQQYCLGQFIKKSTDSFIYLSCFMEHILSVDAETLLPFRRMIGAPSS